MTAEATGECEKSDEGASAGNVVYNMDSEAVRQLRMGLQWVFQVRGQTGSYCIIGWIVTYCQLDWIVSYQMDQETLAFMLWLVTDWMGRMGQMDWMWRWWDRGGTDGC